jgi:hypothetical protein
MNCAPIGPVPVGLFECLVKEEHEVLRKAELRAARIPAQKALAVNPIILMREE